MTVYFHDSQFLVAAWRQLLETQPAEMPIFYLKDRVITSSEVIAFLEGVKEDVGIAEAVSDFFKCVMVEAMHKVRGRFDSGLDKRAQTK